ncbi:uncharacterized protein LOC109598623 [Aethina tumida]|uniref:uncharacterized protein LOC109598623 n=1 Tax=Aethina tumida TaxID=116153 RepID=UPI00096B0DE1|nr:uncharacterized protein LOC109598623 [Aethina tumida]
MILSRGAATLRSLRSLQKNSAQFNQAIRNSSHGWNYRSAGPPASPFILRFAEVAQGVAWWWILWHLWTEPGHIFGEFEYPDPSKWTDAELGVE